MARDGVEATVQMQPKKSGGVLGLLLATLIATGAGIGATFVQTSLITGAKETEAHGDAGDKSHSAPKAKSVVDLPPIVTNLTRPRDVWIRIELSLVFDKPPERAEQIAAQFGTDVLRYLRTLGAEQIEGPAGLLDLREELNERAATRSNGAVGEVVIRTLVVQ